MNFIADKQTLEDLNLLGKYKPHSIYSLFNRVHTHGGERLLEEMFHHPLTQPDDINRRSSIFRYFQERDIPFPLSAETFRIAAHYLGAGTAGNCLVGAAGMLRSKISASLLRDDQYALLQGGLIAAIRVLNDLKDFLARLEKQPGPYSDEAQTLRNILCNDRLAWLEQERKTLQLPFLKLVRYNYLFRHTMRLEIEALLEGIWRLDVYLAVSKVSREKSLSFATARPAEEHLFRAAGIRHPALAKAVANPLFLHPGNNLLFLTGANMAGKSTFMKSFGIAVYLAHMGFPVAAGEMEFSVMDGLYSSINVPDSLSMGYSHFYAEVLRVKTVAEAVSSGKNLVVIFDELFKGTNVKDAYDATLSVTKAFSRYRSCFFIVSTHIVEAGEALKACENIQFSFLPTVMEGVIPKYPYTLTAGISGDRHGMMIIRNEKIPDMLRS
ncbi:DNA mismatch repair protein [Chitinophaga sp. XS-30]|uniref:MutS-related protein n=1 Tax=Chitinophaga sp. XS-30 TaxID=2604421 RepID=UPI0011DE00AB|nr:DNA mismatch repair protein [Chitinophaga sp. XS-30]QEH43359.1 DNA mismatch repair protein [Chitinophaga sp. XS-30]